MMTWSTLMLQDSGNPLMEQLAFFHDYTLFMILLIIMLVSYLMTTTMFNNLYNHHLIEEQIMELIWTIIPVIILVFIALPSLHLLYLMDEHTKYTLTLKIIGHQWYWSYEYSDFMNVDLDSYLKPTNNSINNHYRLLDVTNKLTLPMNTPIRLIVTSQDVIHSWTIPSLGIKMDAIPGRLNQTNLTMNRPSMYIGQCSEICGINHSFMPICIESITLKNFMNWLKTFS
nr:cytochrome c oxidase subunit II [Peloridora minuta]